MSLKSRYLFLLIMNFTILPICRSQSFGYSNLDSLYADFVHNLKSGDKDLKAYCYKINPDSGTVKFMEKHNLSYEGIPNEMKKRGMPVNILGDRYFQMAKDFKESLTARNLLENLKYTGRVEQGEEEINKQLGIYMTETLIILDSGNITIKCNLGEMMKMDGKWKVFSDPKLGIFYNYH